METERKLFEKSLDELRETFVRNRFKQKDVFGRPDIEEWIDAQQKAEDPEYDRATGESYWNAHVLAGYRMRWGASHDPLAVLREYATPHAGSSSSRKPARDLPLEEHPFDADAQIQCIPLLNSFMRAELYYGYRLGVIVVARDRINHPHPYTVRVGAKGLIIASFDQDPERAAVFTMDVLFAEWLYGRSRARWQGARNFLAAGLQLEIRGKRSNAETDFDTAVAVSAYGTKIVEADWVVVWSPKKFRSDRAAEIPHSVSVRPASVFAKKKIRRFEAISRLRDVYEPPRHRQSDAREGTKGDPIRMGNVLREQWVAWRQDQDKQWLLDLEVTAESRRTVRVFITPDTECPSPLPDGGVEVTV